MLLGVKKRAAVVRTAADADTSLSVDISVGGARIGFSGDGANTWVAQPALPGRQEKQDISLTPQSKTGVVSDGGGAYSLRSGA
jgi:hypothetical protein